MKTITLTSKNQVTIPAAIVRKLQLAKTHQLTVEQRGNEIILTPQLSLDERFAALWQANAGAPTRTFSDDEIAEGAKAAWEAHVQTKFAK